jgi:hypothetical protein
MDVETTLGPYYQVVVPLISSTLAVVVVQDSRQRGMPLLAIGLSVWFVAAFLGSTQNVFLASPTQFQPQDDLPGFVTFGALLVCPLMNVYILYQAIPALKHYLVHEIPPPNWIALQTYRLVAGSCFLTMYSNGSMTHAVGLQTGVLDTVIGVTALPLAYWVHTTTNTHRGGLKNTNTNTNIRTIVLVWNAIGLYSWLSAFGLVVANFLGYYEVHPALSMFGFYPISLIALFQVPIAIGTHILFLSNIDQIMGALLEVVVLEEEEEEETTKED